MLVVGLYDGNIAVYNLQKNVGVPNYQSDAKNGKHRDIVWQVNRQYTDKAGIRLENIKIFWNIPLKSFILLIKCLGNISQKRSFFN